jgi:hypothetical protein
MTEKPPVWADWLLTFWVIVVGVFYFGGYFFPMQIGRYTVSASALYALMLLVSAAVLALRILRRAEAQNKK